MSKPLASIVIPAIPGREERLKMILSRLSLNQSRYTDKPFEVIVVDGSQHGEYRQLCEYAMNVLTLKYVHLPIGKFINAGYPRNVGFRLAEGTIFSQIDIDWYISEDFIAGMLGPYEQGLGVVNNGYMIDSSTSTKVNQCPDYLEGVNAALLDQKNGMDKEIRSIFQVCEIPPPKLPEFIWLWAAPARHFLGIHGYDEMYCRKWAYTREDDDLFWRLVCSGLPRFGHEFERFCGIHLWHPAGQRNNALNQLNKDYYNSLIHKDGQGGIIVDTILRNENRDWGKMTADSYAIIKGGIYDFYAIEEWIEANNKDVAVYLKPWSCIDEVVESLEN